MLNDMHKDYQDKILSDPQLISNPSLVVLFYIYNLYFICFDNKVTMPHANHTSKLLMTT